MGEDGVEVLWYLDFYLLFFPFVSAQGTAVFKGDSLILRGMNDSKYTELFLNQNVSFTLALPVTLFFPDTTLICFFTEPKWRSYLQHLMGQRLAQKTINERMRGAQ
jgi:hypothetical protein